MLKIAGIVLTELLAYALLRQYKPELAVFSQLGAAAVLIFLVGDELRETLGFFDSLFSAGEASSLYVSVLIKVLGITLITQVLSDMCRDSGDSAAATKLEFAGKVIITAVSLPVIKGFVTYIAGLVNGV